MVITSAYNIRFRISKKDSMKIEKITYGRTTVTAILPEVIKKLNEVIGVLNIMLRDDLEEEECPQKRDPESLM